MNHEQDTLKKASHTPQNLYTALLLSSLSSAPYDAIHVGAAAPTIPEALIAQLKSPGRMFIPVGTMNQAIMQVDKDENGLVKTQELFNVMVSRATLFYL